MSRIRKSASSERGAALLIAIAAAAFLTAIAVEITGAVQDEARLLEAYRDGFRARWAVRAPLALVKAALRDKESFTGFTQGWAQLPETLRVEGVEVRFQVRDEGGKINLNLLAATAPADRDRAAGMLGRLFEEKNLRPELADALEDWADADDQVRPGGAENAYYQSLRAPYPAKNGPLDTLSELRLVRGFTEEVLQTLDFPQRAGRSDLDLGPWLTLYSDGKVNLNTADPLVVRSLIAGIPESAIADLVDRRRDRPFEKLLDIKELTGMTDALYNQLSAVASVESSYFSVAAEARSGAIRKRLSAILRKEGDKVYVVFWRMS